MRHPKIIVRCLPSPIVLRNKEQVASFHTRSSHVPGIPFCPFCPCDPFSPSMKKQAYKKRLYGMDLEKRTCFAICH